MRLLRMSFLAAIPRSRSQYKNNIFVVLLRGFSDPQYILHFVDKIDNTI